MVIIKVIIIIIIITKITIVVVMMMMMNIQLWTDTKIKLTTFDWTFNGESSLHNSFTALSILSTVALVVSKISFTVSTIILQVSHATPPSTRLDVGQNFFD